MKDEELPTDAELVEIIDLLDEEWVSVSNSIQSVVQGMTRAGGRIPENWLDETDHTREEVLT